MNRLLFLGLIVALTAGAPLLAAGGDVGEPAPDFRLSDTWGKKHSLSDYRGKVVVLEWINPGCPFSMRHIESRTMIDLAASGEDLIWLAINSTSEDHKDFLDARSHHALNQAHDITYPVLLDPSGKTGHAYHAKTTPHMFVIDEEGVVIYNGAIDDDAYGKKRNGKNYVAMALEAHAEGKAPDPATTKPYGCSVKYQK
jgi:peroxiredoxin